MTQIVCQKSVIWNWKNSDIWANSDNLSPVKPLPWTTESINFQMTESKENQWSYFTMSVMAWVSAAEPDLITGIRLNNVTTQKRKKLNVKLNGIGPAAEDAIGDWGEFVSHSVGNPGAL